jgi:two-component system nitrogen regulation sensor histidine kinase GlnL
VDSDLMPNEELTHRVLENLETAVLLFDSEPTLRYLNPASEILFEVSARHLLGQKALDLLTGPGDVIETTLNRVLESDRPFTERELGLVLPNGNRVTVDCAFVPLLEGDLEGGFLLEIRSIDRQLRITREEQMQNQQQVAREMIRGLAHEIKNPLGGLRGAAQLLERELNDPALSEYTQVIIEEADRLQSLVNRMLGPHRLLEPEEVNIHLLLERVRTLVLAEYGNRLRINRDFDPSIPELSVDSDRIIQALLNIVGNAANAIGEREDGEIVLRTRILRQFTLGSRCHRLALLIEIEDNGPGIPEEIQDRLFYPLVTSGSNGVGLGLSIAQTLVSQHGGLIEWRSEPGKTVFSVILPMEQDDDK